jgi:tetratricopeptide (TPR) repeat protein
MKIQTKILVAGLVVCLSVAGVCLRAQNPARARMLEQFHASLAQETKGDIDGALKSMTDVQAGNEGDYLLNLRLGWLNYLTGNYAESVRYYQTASHLADQTSVEALLGLRLPLAALKDWGAVAETYQHILQLDSGNKEANLRLGQIYLYRGEFVNAKPFLDKARTAFPADYEANLSCAWDSYYLQDFGLSRRCFETALMLSPGDTSATRGMQLVK